MDKVIVCARELGKAMQADERYIRFMAAQQQNDDDKELGALIADFTGAREKLALETQKDDRSGALIGELTTQVREMYARIFENENMKNFAAAREEFSHMMTFVNQIIAGSQNGLDPDAIELSAESGCGGGGCGSGCGGCK